MDYPISNGDPVQQLIFLAFIVTTALLICWFGGRNEDEQ